MEEKINKDNIIESSLTSKSIEDIKKQQMMEMEKWERADRLPSSWKIDKKKKKSIDLGLSLFGSELGLYAAIPLLCKGESCPYATLFPDLHKGEVEEGERCPVEVSFIMTRYDQYMKELGVNVDDAVDMSLLRDLIDFDIQILRADNKISLNGDVTEMQVVAISEGSGTPIYKEEISAIANYKDRIQNKRNKTLEMLNSTRKDKAGMKINHVLDPSSYAAQLLKQVKNSKDVPIIADFEELEIIEDVPYMAELNKDNLGREFKMNENKNELLSFEELYDQGLIKDES